MEIKCGVPQGSVLGPILFNIAINNLLNTFHSSYAYADDTIVFCESNSISHTLDLSKSLLQNVSNWYRQNGLLLNLDKTQFCIFSNRKILGTHNLSIGSIKIQSQPNLKILGVILDSNLTFTSQIENITKKSNKLLYLISRAKKYMNVEQALTAYKTTIRPILEYCFSIYMLNSQKNSNALEKVQNKAIRVILSAPSRFSVTTGRLLLNLHTLTSRRNYLFHKFVHKRIAKRKVSKHILLIINNSSHHNRSLRQKTILIKPTFRTQHGQSSLINLLHTFSNKLLASKNYLSFTT